MTQLRDKVDKFQAGEIGNRMEAWKALTSDKNILDIIEHGLSISFIGDPPEQTPFEYPRGKKRV